MDGFCLKWRGSISYGSATESCQILSVDSACLSLATFVVLTTVTTHSRALQARIRGPRKE